MSEPSELTTLAPISSLLQEVLKSSQVAWSREISGDNLHLAVLFDLPTSPCIYTLRCNSTWIYNMTQYDTALHVSAHSSPQSIVETEICVTLQDAKVIALIRPTGSAKTVMLGHISLQKKYSWKIGMHCKY